MSNPWSKDSPEMTPLDLAIAHLEHAARVWAAAGEKPFRTPGRDLGRFLVRLRQTHGTTQGNFCRKVGLTCPKLARLEKRRVLNPEDETWESVAQALRVSREELERVCETVGHLELAITGVFLERFFDFIVFPRVEGDS